MSIVTYENVGTPIFDIYYPRYLFASGEDGSLLPDLSAPVTSLFQDAAGTIPVVDYGDFVGLAVDQSQNGRDWVQATNAARMRYDELAGQPILFADLADDAMDIELPAISGGTIVLAGEKGIWIDEFDFAGGTFTYGPTTYTGGPDGLIENIVGERLIGGFVIDRALTATERAQSIDYYMSRGAPGVWAAGQELVTNGDFSDGLTGWTGTSPSTELSIVDGRLRVTNTAAVSANVGVTQSLVVGGGAYIMVADIDMGTVERTYYGRTGEGVLAKTSGAHSSIFIGAGSDVRVVTNQISAPAGSYYEVSSVSFRKLELVT